MTEQRRATRLPVVPGDVVRVAALVSVVVAAFVLGGVGVALFLLVLGGVMVPRALPVPAALDVAYGLALLVAAWAAQLGWYQVVPWLDLVVHAVCTGLIAVLAYILLEHAGMAPGPGGAGDRSRRDLAAVVVATTGLGAVAAILWEIGEWAGNAYLNPEIGVGYTDTIGDLAWALVGAVVAGAALAGSRRSGRGDSP